MAKKTEKAVEPKAEKIAAILAESGLADNE